jgi:hypothetical protein
MLRMHFESEANAVPDINKSGLITTGCLPFAAAASMGLYGRRGQTRCEILTVVVHGDEVVGVLRAGRNRPDLRLVPVARDAAQRVTVRIKLQHLDLRA